jgi:hypothetical protein
MLDCSEIGAGAHQVVVELSRPGGIGDRGSQTGAQQQQHGARADQQTEDEKHGVHGAGQHCAGGGRKRA